IHSKLNGLDEGPNGKLRGYNTNQPVIPWYSIFETPLKAYEEAIKCYEYRILEASMVMCRNSIDAMIYTAITTARTEDPINNRRYYSMYPDLTLRRWPMLKKSALTLGIIKEQDVESIE